MTDKTINIAQLIYEAYPHADLLPIDPEKDCRDLPTLLAKVTGENIGDGLFTFMVIEIVEGGESMLSGAVRVIMRAREDVEALLQALQAAMPDHNGAIEYQAAGSGIDLLAVCKTLTSYTCDLLYRLDDQVDLSEIEELRQAKEAIENYQIMQKTPTEQFHMTLQEQPPHFPQKSVMLRLLAQDGQLWIRPDGYGEKCASDGEGSPVGMEIWEDRLRLVVFDNINSEDPQIIDLENAKESNRVQCNWCKTAIGADSIRWKGLLFCSESCLDACRAAQ